jgi:murein DD-endopeptidase MepM/ murein hydrolase activator NlpD
MMDSLKDLDLSDELYNQTEETPQEKKSGFFNTLTFQVILCLVIVIVLVVLNTFFPTQYADIDREMTEQIQQDGGFSEQIKSIWDKLTGTPSGTQDTVSQQAVSEQESMTESSEQTQSAVSDQAAGGEPNAEVSTVSESAVPKSISVGLPLDSIQVTSAYGSRTHPITGEQDFHNGMDLASDEGDPIYAVASGTVSEAEYSEGYGYHVQVDHPDGTSSFYAHCSKLLVKQGDTVTQGQTIAQVGSTGMSTGPHLHFSFLVNGNYVNPADVIQND